VLEYVLVAVIVGGDYSRAGGEGNGSESAVPNTTDRSVVNHPNTFDLYLCEDVRNEGGKEGNYSATIELDRTASAPTDLEL